ncbi:MAG: hypothetical protein II815_07535, partial [Bacteroidales bacterium]|nr:hypothetical protein [Bacteroidales bacterium]
ALNNKQPLCNMYIDGTNASSGTVYTGTVNAIAKGYAPMLNVGGIYLPLVYVSVDPNDFNVLWYHFEDSVDSTNTVYHRIVKPGSITNSDTTGRVGTNSEYAQKIGTSSYHPNVGNAYKAVHVNQSGVLTECSGYFVAGKDSNGNDARYTIVVGATGTDPNTIYFS